MPSTIIVEYTDEEEDTEGKAELYGNDDDFDVVTIWTEDRNRIEPDSPRFKRLREQLLTSQYVYDTLCEALWSDSREDA